MPSDAHTHTYTHAHIHKQIHEQTLALLEKDAPSVVSKYLEYLIDKEHEEWPKYHNKLVEYYLKDVVTRLREYRKEVEGR